jgi:hypothetical protein
MQHEKRGKIVDHIRQSHRIEMTSFRKTRHRHCFCSSGAKTAKSASSRNRRLSLRERTSNRRGEPVVVERMLPAENQDVGEVPQPIVGTLRKNANLVMNDKIQRSAIYAGKLCRFRPTQPIALTAVSCHRDKDQGLYPAD